jgi:hypothetical protein
MTNDAERSREAPETAPRFRAKVSRLGNRVLPVVVSVGLIAWLLHAVSLKELGAAFVTLNWALLAPVTAAMVVALYICDAVCLKVLFAVEGRVVRFRQALLVRGKTYVLGAFNYELGQGAIAWLMARLQNISLISALSRSVLLVYHDLLVLLAAGLIGASLGDDPRLIRVRWICVAGLGPLLLIGLVFWLAPASYRQWLRQSKWGSWMASWSWRRSALLALWRTLYFAILVIYAAVALTICRIPVSPTVVVSTVPLVLLADGLPSVTGLGTRETALMLLLEPKQPERLLAMSLVWSGGMIVVRLAIGLLLLWTTPRIPAPPHPSSA